MNKTLSVRVEHRVTNTLARILARAEAVERGETPPPYLQVFQDGR